jgi:hypothetical protein
MQDPIARHLFPHKGKASRPAAEAIPQRRRWGELAGPYEGELVQAASLNRTPAAPHFEKQFAAPQPPVEAPHLYLRFCTTGAQATDAKSEI